MNVFITHKAKRELDRIPDSLAHIIVKNILALEIDPYPAHSKKISGKNFYRIRIGSYRVLYEANTKEKEITVLRVADRKNVYKHMP